MDTTEKYLDDEFYVVLAGERPDEKFIYTNRGVDDIHEGSDIQPARDHHYIGEEPPVDGWVTFYDPDLLDEGEPFKHGTFPFRDHSKDNLWFALPDEEKGSKHPVWKWQNPDEDPHENLTLKPSIGMGDNFHCWIEQGEIRWV